MRRWFLSYTSQDYGLTQALKAALQRKDSDADIFFAPEKMRAGGFWKPQLAKEIQESTAFILLVGEKLGDWQVMEYYEALDRRAKEPDYPIILILSAKRPAPGLPFARQLHWVLTEDPASETTIGKLLDAAEGTGTGAGKLWRYTAPYRGLTAMTEADGGFFFGRDNKIIEVVKALVSAPDRIPVLFGNSGVGKSSLAQAGVLACLRRQNWTESMANADAWPQVLHDSRGWCFLTMRPGEEPLRELVEPFLRTWQLDPTGTLWAQRQTEWVSALSDGKLTLRDLLDATYRRFDELNQPRPPCFFLYVDQGEELYVRAKEDQRARFSEVIAQNIVDLRLRALISLRADFLGALQNDEALFSVHHKIDVPPLREGELCEVVSRPAELLSARFETDDLAAYIAHGTAVESTKDAGALPLLSYLLDDMWKQMVRRDDGVLRLPAPAFDLGGVLVERADAFVSTHPNSQGALRRVLTIRLATVRKEGEPTRRRAHRSEFSDDEWRLVVELADYPNRLLVTATPEGGETYAEVAHEAIFSRWDKLREWINAQREFLAWKTTLDDDRSRWESVPDDSKKDALLLGLALAQAQSWLVQRGEDLSKADREFISISLRQAELERQREEERERIKVEQTAQLNILRERAEAARRLNRQTWAAVGIFAIFATITGWQWEIARTRTQETAAAQSLSRLTVNSVQSLLNQIGDSLGYGSISQKGAKDLLDISAGILGDVKGIEQTLETAGLLIQVQQTRHDILYDLGEFKAAYDRMKVARELLAPFTILNEQNPQALSFAFSISWRMADDLADDPESDEADLAKALDEFAYAERTARALLALSPDVPERQRRVMFIMQKRGDLRQRQQDWPGAIRDYRQALHIIETVVKNDSTHIHAWNRDLANCHSRLGQSFWNSNDLVRAKVEFDQAFEIRKELRDEDPNDNMGLINLALSYMEMGMLFERANKLDDALKQFQFAKDIRLQLYNKDPNNAARARQLSPVYMYLGEVLSKLNKLDEASNAYRQAVDLRDKLADRDPSNFTFKDQLAESHAALAEVLRRQKALDDALQSYEKAVELVVDLIENRPKRAIKYRGRAYDIYMNMGDIYDDAKKNGKEAFKRYESAAGIAKPLAEQENDPAWQGKLAWAYQRMGDELAVLSDPAGALERYKAALAVLKVLAGKHEADPEWRNRIEQLQASIDYVQARL